MRFLQRVGHQLQQKYPELGAPIQSVTAYAYTQPAIQRIRGFTWRKGGDLNPREACTPDGFRDRSIRPLWHPSILEGYRRESPARLGSKKFFNNSADSCCNTPLITTGLWFMRGSAHTLYKLDVAPPFRSAAPKTKV